MTASINARRRGRVMVYEVRIGGRVYVSSVSRTLVRAARRWLLGKDTSQDRVVLRQYGRLLRPAGGGRELLVSDVDTFIAPLVIRRPS